MKTTLKLLISLSIAAAAQAQVWQTAAMPDITSGTPPPAYGRISARLFGASFKDARWNDQRANVTIGIGIGNGLGVNLATSMRSVRGFGAFETGIEDSRVGLSYWPQVPIIKSLTLGASGNFIVPTGYRQQELYFDPATDSSDALPSLSLKQTAGEFCFGARWVPHNAAAMRVFAGYLETSDRSTQAFRWGMGAALAPFGPGYTIELDYAKSETRTGILANTDVLSAGLAVKLLLGITITPGVWADLKDKPLYGGAIALKLDAPLSHNTFPNLERNVKDKPLVQAKFKGAVLVPPPQTDLLLASRDELWQQLRENVGGAFDQCFPLRTLDLPGLPFDERDPSKFWNTMSAIHAEHPDARWLLLTHVDREEVSRAEGMRIPLLVSQPAWSADCRLRVQLVDLREQVLLPEQVVDGQSIRRDGVRLSIFSPAESEVLSFSESMQLTLDAYNKAGQQALKQLGEGQ